MEAPGASDVSGGKVDAFHQALLKVLQEHLQFGPKAMIEQLAAREPRDWSRADAGKLIEFHLLEKGDPEKGERLKGGSVPVFRLKSESWWGSWYERWYSLGSSRFRPDRFGFTLWQGALGPGKQQILRAEWDHVSTGSSGAAQPHWHIDVPLTQQVEVAPRALALDAGGDWGPGETVDELKAETLELGLQALPGRSISKVHLGMRGHWDGPERGWRRSWTRELKEVPLWLQLCLGYLATEISRA